MFKNALVSCSDKSGLADFLRPYVASGMRIVSTGGTAQYLRENGFVVVDVSEQTGFPEVMGGRVKTLHPHIHMGLLARKDNADDSTLLKKMNIAEFDLVVGNLYPFENEPGPEMIDVGGPSFLRAAAKNFARVTVVCDPRDYLEINNMKAIADGARQRLAAKVFAHTSSYDAMIAEFLAPRACYEFTDHGLGGERVQQLRYGENPQQKAVWFRRKGALSGLHKATILQGKELSYNNILDIDAALSTMQEFKAEKCLVAVKHNSPCGVAWGEVAAEVTQRGVSADPQSVFGAIVVLNYKLDVKSAEILSDVFLECVVVPDIDAAAADIIAKKKNLRLLKCDMHNLAESSAKLRSIWGGYLLQEQDAVASDWPSDWQTLGSELNSAIKKDLLAAWRVCAHLKSNAIAITSNGQTVGLGMGQVNRVDAVQQAIARMQKFHPACQDAVLASDAFFPFSDSIEIIANAGIKYIIQPGGSLRDEEVLKKASELGVAVVLTGTRHFLH